MLDEIKRLMDAIGMPIKLMEVCGTHTVSIFRHGIRSLIPDSLSLLSGPGCPVCVTSIKDVDTAVKLSETEGVTVVTFGDMMRVPGSKASLYEARANGRDVRVIYSPMDALKIAEKEKNKKVVFFATGFETTSPLIAVVISEAEDRGIKNFYIYSTHKLIPPALNALLQSPEVKVDGFILPGHVSTIIGRKPYEFIASRYGKPAVITGFDAGDIIEAILMLLRQIKNKSPQVEIQYKSVVREEGNPKALSVMNRYFEPCDAYWRGIGVIPKSGLRLRDEFSRFDALKAFNPQVSDSEEPHMCSCGDVLRGLIMPTECPLFGTGCTPESPIGACMVSEEGSCSAYYKYIAKRV